MLYKIYSYKSIHMHMYTHVYTHTQHATKNPRDLRIIKLF